MGTADEHQEPAPGKGNERMLWSSQNLWVWGNWIWKLPGQKQSLRSLCGPDSLKTLWKLPVVTETKAHVANLPNSGRTVPLHELEPQMPLEIGCTTSSLTRALLAVMSSPQILVLLFIFNFHLNSQRMEPRRPLVGRHHDCTLSRANKLSENQFTCAFLFSLERSSNLHLKIQVF